MKSLIAVCVLVILTACSPPTTRTATVADEPTMTFVGAPSSAEVFLNGLNIGKAAEFDGKPKSLIVPRGTHFIEIKDGAKVLLSEKVFVSDGANKSFNLKGLK